MARAFKDFPPAYFDILEKVADGEKVERMMTRREANAIRRDLYRFFQAIVEGMDAGDQFASSLNETSRNIMVSLFPGNVGPSDTVTLTIQINPLVGLEMSLEQETAPRPSPGKKPTPKEDDLDGAEIPMDREALLALARARKNPA